MRKNNDELRYEIDRDTYKAIKRMDREQMISLLTSVYVSGKKEGSTVTMDLSSIREGISQIKGIGEARLEQIMEVIKNNIEEVE